ncbi:VOC family protein [Rhodanobacter sp. Si-c]|uniref:VOC family protein n=1 Tax=Rhodanobacter lycopersici TaxID=3162487 RepID=A0ABV3QHM7_9GAMM
MPESISHIALIVCDPARTAELFAGVFGARVISDADDDGHRQSLARFGGVWFVLRQGEGPSVRNGDHIAFEVEKAELPGYAAKLVAFGVEYFMAREDSALYFTDYDNHVFELDGGGSMDEGLAERT